MRVTQSMLNNSMLTNLNRSMQNMDRLQDMLASGKKVNKPSDDPVGAVRSMFHRTNLIEIDQFQRNATEGLNWMELTDQTMDSAVNVLHRARELLVRAANDSMAETSRFASAEEVREIKEQLGSLANSSIGGRYIFAGTQTKSKPYSEEVVQLTERDLELVFNEAEIDAELSFDEKVEQLLAQAGVETIEELAELPLNPDLTDPDATAADLAAVPAIDRAVQMFQEVHGRYSKTPGSFTNTNKSEIRIEMGQGIFLPINVLGTDIFTDPEDPDDPRRNVFRILDDIMLTMQEGQVPAVDGQPSTTLTGLIQDLDYNIDYIISKRAMLGAKVNRIELVQSRLADSEFSVTKLLSEAEDAEIPKVIIDLKSQENIHQAALSSGSRIIQQTLLDFIR